jgi:hypothetical protein
MKMIKFGLLVAALSAAFLLAGCETINSVLEPARKYAGKGAATAIEGECALSTEQRLANLTSVNAALAEMGSEAHALSLDCDGDNQPDILKVE